MLYPFISFPDGTEITHSELLHKDGQQQVRVYVEQWNDEHRDFDRLEMYLPSGTITENVGFSAERADYHYNHLWRLQDVILECAAEKEG